MLYIRDSNRWQKCSEDDLLIARYGASLGKICTGKSGAYNVALTKLLFNRNNLDKGWVEAFLKSPWFQAPLFLVSRSAQNGFNKDELSPRPVPLPPLNEQRRIVAKIEALKARSQQVKEALEAIPPLLDQFRQSVLAAAFRGDLTADWREKNPDVEPASVLLERIRAERHRCWEETELEKMKANGKTPMDDKWKSKYKEPELTDSEGLPEIPASWSWGTPDLICSDIADCPHETAEYTEQGKILVRTSDFRLGKLNISQTKFVAEETFEKRVKRLRPAKGDVLYSREGGIFGIACPVPELEICMGQRMMLLRADKTFYDEKLLMWFMNAPQVFGQAKSKVIGTASPHVNVADIKRFYLPIPPLNEQHEILRRIDKYFRTINVLYTQLLSATGELTKLDQSILAKAFRGELVPQDPNDEPASVLLERIRAERAKREAETKAAKKSTGETNGRRSRKAKQQDSESVQLELPGVE